MLELPPFMNAPRARVLLLSALLSLLLLLLSMLAPLYLLTRDVSGALPLLGETPAYVSAHQRWRDPRR